MTDTLLWIMVAVSVLAVLAGLVASTRRRGGISAPTGADPVAPSPASDAGPRAPDPPRDDVALRRARRIEQDVGLRPGPYPGSALPAPDGSAPNGQFIVKAEEARKRYYTPGYEDYPRLRADLWFQDAADADAAGFRPVHE
jgi:hypothetical protein